MRRDPVTSAVRQQVLQRDQWCVATRLGALDICRGRGGFVLLISDTYRLELDHVKDQPAMGIRAPSDPAHLVALCHHHHQGGWATSHRPLLRAYLRHVSTGLQADLAAHRARAEFAS